MVVYEVNLKVEKEIIKDFKAWLKEHVSAMLKFSGFERAEILEEEDESENLSVRYYLISRQDLEDYLQNHAEKMRGGGILKFKDKFSAKRRILYLKSRYS